MSKLGSLARAVMAIAVVLVAVWATHKLLGDWPGWLKREGDK